MKDLSFENHLNEASEIVSKWPAWKRGVLRESISFSVHESDGDSMKPSFTIETLQQIMDDMQSAQNTIPGELWLRIARARSALQLAFLKAHAVQSLMKAEALEAKDQL